MLELNCWCSNMRWRSLKIKRDRRYFGLTWSKLLFVQSSLSQEKNSHIRQSILVNEGVGNARNFNWIFSHFASSLKRKHVLLNRYLDISFSFKLSTLRIWFIFTLFPRDHYKNNLFKLEARKDKNKKAYKLFLQSLALKMAPLDLLFISFNFFLSIPFVELLNLEKHSIPYRRCRLFCWI